MTLEKLYSSYDRESLGKALFTISSWISNRRYVHIVDDLNTNFLDLPISHNIMKSSINNYNEFQQFYRKLINYINVPGFPEDIPLDKGEVYFSSNGRSYKILVGNGAEDTYENCFIIDKIIQEVGEEYDKNIWSKILLYEDRVIDVLYDGNMVVDENFECPPRSYYEKVFENYFTFSDSDLAYYFKDFEGENNQLYSFFTNHDELPIFLPTMKECFLENLLINYHENKIRLGLWDGFINLLRKNYLIENNKQDILMYPLIIDDKILDYSLGLFHEDTAIIFISQQYKEDIPYIKYEDSPSHLLITGLHTNHGNNKTVKIDENKKIIYQSIDDVNFNPNEATMILGRKQDDLSINPQTLVGLFNYATDINEIVKFITYFNTRDKQRTINSSGTLALFHSWRDADEVLDEGASESMLVIMPYRSAHETHNYFSSAIRHFPINYDENLSLIHSWNKKKDELTALSLVRKDNSNKLQIFVVNDRKIMLFESSTILEDQTEESISSLNSFEEIMENGINEFKETIMQYYSGQILDLRLVSKKLIDHYSEQYDVIKTKYCRKVEVKKHENNVTFIQPFWKKIIEDSLESQTKKFENDLLKSMLHNLQYLDTEKVFEEINKTNSELRTSKIERLEIPYYINPHISFSQPTNTAFKMVRKLIAITIKKLSLEPGEYQEEKITNVVRRFRNEIRDALLINLSCYSKIELHELLLNIYSTIVHEIHIHQKRLLFFESKNELDEEIKSNLKKKTITLREELRVYKGVLEYLIDENLSLTERGEERTPSSIEVQELIAFSKWIMDFQSMSDAINYGATGWSILKIRDDFVVEILETEKYLADVRMLQNLKYNYGDYSDRNEALDKDFIDKINIAFKNDTQIELTLLTTLLNILSSHEVIVDLERKGKLKTFNNIVEVQVQHIASYFTEVTNFSLEEFYTALKFIVIETEKLRNQSGVIPIWEKKKRKYKFYAQPIVYIGDSLLFSPVSIQSLEETWIYGILNFVLPYDTDMAETLKVIKAWKKKYEDKIVQDIASIFSDSRYTIYIDQELYKLDKKGNHPRDLGDYDLIVINKVDKEILLFEVKYMRVSQTMKDSMGDQSEYFIGKKAKAKKFQRRVEYFEDNKEKILNNLGLYEDYTLRSYFVANKIIRSYFQYYPFDIIGFNELKEIYKI
ncbi:hypothetical protein [Salinicoccus roseus]|uniref:hypothetical protein n=1 Tax=Salinicoccus roseus TaxID=45670 RepID=UPI002300F6DA|nr:hypothetical protein [Salinicoccus roseus]